MKIGLDFGHGGADPGAQGGGMLEKKINLNVGLKLDALLRDSGHIVTVTRKGDATLDLMDRARILNTAHTDINVSVHHNAGGGHGYDIIHNLNKPESKALGLLIADEFKKLGQTQHKIFSKVGKTGGDYYGMQRMTTAPCVIVEFAFLDTDDVKEVDTLSEQWAEATAIFKAIQRYAKGERVV